MIYILSLFLFYLLYLDNSSSAMVGGTGDRSMYQLVLVLYVAYIAIACVYYSIKRKKIYISSVSIPVLLITLVILLKNYLYGNSSQYNTLRFLYSVSWFIIIVGIDNIFMSMNEKRKNHFMYLMMLLFLYTIYNAIQTFSYISIERDRYVIPTIYLCVMFIPWIIQLRKVGGNNLFWILIFILLGVTVLSNKRGATIAVITSLIVFIFKNETISKGKGSIKIVLKTVTLLIVSFIIFSIISNYLGGALLVKYSEESFLEGSGRREIYSFAIDSIMNISNLTDLFFGFSFDSWELANFGGHNDWLTFLMINGLSGILMFFYFYVECFNHSMSSRSKVSPSYSALFVIMLLQSLYSTSYNPTTHPIIGMMFIGFAEAQIRKETKYNYYERT